MVRHGPGPLPTETEELDQIVSEHNQSGEWQGPVRYGWFDGVLARYAIQIVGALDGLAITHLDLLPYLNTWRYSDGYEDHREFNRDWIECSVRKGILTDVRPGSPLSLEQKTELTRAFFKLKPVYETCPPEMQKVLSQIESMVGQPICLTSRGPTAQDVEGLGPIPA